MNKLAILDGKKTDKNIAGQDSDKMATVCATVLLKSIGIEKTAASISTLLRKAMPVLRRNTTNSRRLGVMMFGDAIKDRHIAGLTGNGVSYVAKKFPVPLPLGGTKVQRSEAHKLRNLLTYAHEHAERKVDVLSWDKVPKPFMFEGGAHHGVSPMIAEHNIITTLSEKLNPKGKLMRSLADRVDIAKLEELVHGFQFGRSPRLSRHAIKNLDRSLSF